MTQQPAPQSGWSPAHIAKSIVAGLGSLFAILVEVNGLGVLHGDAKDYVAIAIVALTPFAVFGTPNTTRNPEVAATQSVVLKPGRL